MKYKKPYNTNNQSFDSKIYVVYLHDLELQKDTALIVQELKEPNKCLTKFFSLFLSDRQQERKHVHDLVRKSLGHKNFKIKTFKIKD